MTAMLEVLLIPSPRADGSAVFAPTVACWSGKRRRKGLVVSPQSPDEAAFLVRQLYLTKRRACKEKPDAP